MNVFALDIFFFKMNSVSVPLGDGRRENYQTDHPTPEPLLLQIQDPLPDVMVDKSQLQQDPLNNGIKQEFDMVSEMRGLTLVGTKSWKRIKGASLFLPLMPCWNSCILLSVVFAS